MGIVVDVPCAVTVMLPRELDDALEGGEDVTVCDMDATTD